jgi:cellobiose-specific phosphotransferase system component IIB
MCSRAYHKESELGALQLHMQMQQSKENTESCLTAAQGEQMQQHLKTLRLAPQLHMQQSKTICNLLYSCSSSSTAAQANAAEHHNTTCLGALQLHQMQQSITARGSWLVAPQLHMQMQQSITMACCSISCIKMQQSIQLHANATEHLKPICLLTHELYSCSILQQSERKSKKKQLKKYPISIG